MSFYRAPPRAPAGNYFFESLAPATAAGIMAAAARFSDSRFASRFFFSSFFPC